MLFALFPDGSLGGRAHQRDDLCGDGLSKGVAQDGAVCARSVTMSSTWRSGTGPWNRQVNAVATHSWLVDLCGSGDPPQQRSSSSGVNSTMTSGVLTLGRTRSGRVAGVEGGKAVLEIAGTNRGSGRGSRSSFRVPLCRGGCG